MEWLSKARPQDILQRGKVQLIIIGSMTCMVTMLITIGIFIVLLIHSRIIWDCNMAYIYNVTDPTKIPRRCLSTDSTRTHWWVNAEVVATDIEFSTELRDRGVHGLIVIGVLLGTAICSPLIWVILYILIDFLRRTALACVFLFCYLPVEICTFVKNSCKIQNPAISAMSSIEASKQKVRNHSLHLFTRKTRNKWNAVYSRKS